jgi:hypothetical protein
MGSEFILRIREEEVCGFWNDLENHLSNLFRRSLEAGLIDPQNDYELMIFILEFQLRLSVQNPNRKSIEPSELKQHLIQLMSLLPKS